MGRKKKGQSPRNTQNTPISSHSTEVPVKDALELRLLRPPANAKTRAPHSITQGQTVFLTENDAKQLDVSNGDQVLLISPNKRKDGSDKMAALCNARIIPPTSIGGTPSKREGNKNLRVGSCRVEPISLAYRLLGTGEDTVTKSSVQTPSSVVSPPKTPLSTSSSKSSFSFAKGGGGDDLISPPRTPSTPSKPAAISKNMVCVIPLDSDLGFKLQSMLCREASAICLAPVESESSSLDDQDTISSCRRILSRLILASGAGNFYQVGDLILSSFRGVPVEWEVKSIQSGAETAADSSLEEDFAELSLEEANLESSMLNDILQSVKDRINQGGENGLTLYKMDYKTEIFIEQDSDNGLESPGRDDEDHYPLVAGLDPTIEEVESLLLPPLLQPELFAKGSLRPPRGLLLHGPSGVGKSALAQQISNDMKKRGIHVVSVNCTSLQSHTAIVGEAEQRLGRLFRSVEKLNQPSLLVLDDIHLICPKRGGSSAGLDRLSATLLALLDGIGGSTKDKKATVMILGVTTNTSLLDPALRRPGRLDAEVEVPIPDEKTRASIIRFQLNQLGQGVELPSFSEADIMDLSRLAKGFNGADCLLAIKEALRTAMIRSVSSSLDTNPSPPVVCLDLQDLRSSIRSIKPSTIKSITVEIPQVRWSSIGGMDSVKEKLREAIELPLTHAHLFEALSIPPPRGVLLYGPPGCSKTLMARALATEGQMNFLAVKGPELLSKWLGESERALASLFRRARMASPCIIFFDEIDAIASKRGSGSHSGGERLLSQLLTELDGINSVGSSVPNDKNARNKRVVVVGATNRPDLLDSALMRPGRIDRMIYVGVPDGKSRANILEIGLKGKACQNDIDIPLLASDEVTGGFSGAEMIAICREAALFAIEEDDETMSTSTNRDSHPRVGMKHLLRAANEMQRQITPEMVEFYASFQNGAAP